jgi:hypothetical protein
VIPASYSGLLQQAQISLGNASVRTLYSHAKNYDFGAATVLDFSDLSTAGTYQVTWNGQRSAAFPISASAWKSILPTLTAYHASQRCGVKIPGVHAACHLDDSRRRDSGTSVDTTGGWHDAGDLRKWVDSTLMNLFGVLSIVRNLGANWGPGGLAPLLGEAKYGNAYFLKMQDADGLVWADVGGGVNGDNSDNRWTDNIRGNADDRWLNINKVSNIQAMFIAGQAMMSQVFSRIDATYSATCLNAGIKCWNAADCTSSNTTDLGWWTLAAVEMYRATGQSQYSDEVTRLANQLQSIQFTKFRHNQQLISGYFPMWPNNPEPLRDPVHSGIPAFALLQAAAALAPRPQAIAWSRAAQLYIDGYVTPMTKRSAYGIVPFGVYVGTPTADTYRSLAGNLTYRFFMPASNPWDPSMGLNAHLLSHSVLLAEASHIFGRSDYRDMAYAQLEWVFGNNPFAAALATGLGAQNPPAFSPFVGAISGGIMNGICGSKADTPQLATQDFTYWQTNEYWSPNVGYCEWAISILERTA